MNRSIATILGFVFLVVSAMEVGCKKHEPASVLPPEFVDPNFEILSIEYAGNRDLSATWKISPGPQPFAITIADQSGKQSDSSIVCKVLYAHASSGVTADSRSGTLTESGPSEYSCHFEFGPTSIDPSKKYSLEIILFKDIILRKHIQFESNR